MSDQKAKIERELITLLENKYTPGKVINLDTSISNDIGLDSLDKIEFVMDVETTFSISVSNEDVEVLDTLSDFVNYIDDRVFKKV